MSNLQALFFDTSVLLALFNTNPSEAVIGDEVISFIVRFPHSALLIVSPCLVELIYKTRKLISPSDVRKNFNALQIELFSVGDSLEKQIIESFYEVTHRNDLPLALSRSFSLAGNKPDAQLVTFPG